MTARDHWGWKARLGMFIVSTEAVPEAEWWAMMPQGVSVHAARVKALTPWARWSPDRTHVELEPDIERGAAAFTAMRLSAVTVAHSSSSIAGGRGWDDAIANRLSAVLGPEVIVTTNGRDCRAALKASNIERPFLVFPAWFADESLPKGVSYFAEHGFSPSGHMRVDPGRQWRDVNPCDLYGLGMHVEQDVEHLYRQVRDICPDDADGILLVGTGLRCVGILEQLEQDTRRPVVSANQASLWRCLRLSGVNTPVHGYGKLLLT